MSTKDPCKPYACRIQACLKENRFQEKPCQTVIEDMRDCCRKWKDKSFVCGGIDISKKRETANNEQ
ncbi:cx9C motif-containing protein 4 [Diabrotica virgifera virgifera]|uniref:Cx9C motif-containing protein 4 n=1 Tax=Diabrotica virgifera virgifera TaxID=50390 RepID=A0A6P7FPE6_DIAVI|nr:cx9C motif-containing protein 4 [Diabrotica virgifera virgifera]